jgi:hypothetical protein
MSEMFMIAPPFFAGSSPKVEAQRTLDIEFPLRSPGVVRLPYWSPLKRNAWLYAKSPTKHHRLGRAGPKTKTGPVVLPGVFLEHVVSLALFFSQRGQAGETNPLS